MPPRSGLECFSVRLPGVAHGAQPRAEWCNPFGIELRPIPANPQRKPDAPYRLSVPHGEQHGSTLVGTW